jgi:hypothetical protein
MECGVKTTSQRKRMGLLEFPFRHSLLDLG